MNLYIYSKCSTCQDAVRFLTQHKIEFCRKEITETPPSLKELQAMLGYADGNLKKLFNTSGLLYKEMDLSNKLRDMPLDKALGLLTQHGMLVKRPFLIGKAWGTTGFKEEEWKRLIL